jgi:redox-sensitive bicupin YhaK (pirin superfamily)
MNSSIELVISPRQSDLGGGLKVRRALPFQKKRMVGPFIFLDHMGPVTLDVHQEMKVRSHPHIGLSTLTYLFAGELLHRDTLGTEKMIRPGEVNWMTAGKGIAHSETAIDDRAALTLEGLQIWIALPLSHEEIAPSFVHQSAETIPSHVMGKVHWKLIAGSAFGKSSPVPCYSPLFYLVGESKDESDKFEMTVSENSEGGVYVAGGGVKIDDTVYPEGELVVFKKGAKIHFEIMANSRVAVVGGDIFPEKRFIWWNFVSSSEEKIEAAKKRWQEDGFGHVIHESSRIPLP